MCAKVPAVETDGEKENDANGSEWEVEEVKLGTSVLLSAPGGYIWDFASSKLRNLFLLDQKWGIHHFHTTSALRIVRIDHFDLCRKMLRD